MKLRFLKNVSDVMYRDSCVRFYSIFLLCSFFWLVTCLSDAGGGGGGGGGRTYFYCRGGGGGGGC